MRQFLPALLLLPLLLALTACGPEAVLLSGGATIASYSLTGKSLMDNAMSEASGKDCDLLKLGENDGKYCTAHKLKDDPYFAAVSQPKVYCFNTMGEVECHCSADPYDNHDTPFVKGRGSIAGESCGGQELAMLPTERAAYIPSRQIGTELPPPPLPPEAYQNILEPAARNAAPAARTAGETARRPLDLAPELSGS